MSIRADISKLVGMVIPPNAWKSSFNQLNREGKIGRKEIITILVMLLEREAEREEETVTKVLDKPIPVYEPKKVTPKPVKKKKTGKNVKK